MKLTNQLIIEWAPCSISATEQYKYLLILAVLHHSEICYHLLCSQIPWACICCADVLRVKVGNESGGKKNLLPPAKMHGTLQWTIMPCHDLSCCVSIFVWLFFFVVSIFFCWCVWAVAIFPQFVAFLYSLLMSRTFVCFSFQIVTH